MTINLMFQQDISRENGDFMRYINSTTLHISLTIFMCLKFKQDVGLLQ